MADVDPLGTQRDASTDVVAELAADGLEDARMIGSGGFGVVYQARQRALDRTVAVKVLTAYLDVNNLERFLREQRAMGRLSGHPNIVDIFQVGATASGRPYIVMPFHARGSLQETIQRSGPLPWADTVRLGIKLCGALESVHQAGGVHRDVKPGNILLTDYFEPQLTDFGIARIRGGFETSTDQIVGSPAFTAPEVLRGAVPTPASDVYGLGTTLFCALTGHAAFERRSGERLVAQFVRITTQPVPDLRGGSIPDELCAALEAAMSGEPGDRPATALEFGERLREVQRRQGMNIDEMSVPIGPGSPHPHGSAAPSDALVPAFGTSTTGAQRYRVTTARPPTSESRFRPPVLPRGQVERGRLLAGLRAAEPRLLTVIHAPTGYGKTTLAAQWRAELSGEGIPVAWLTVDRDDNNVLWFLAHLVDAVGRVRPALTHGLVQALEEPGDGVERYVLTSLVNEIDQQGERVVVVVDDWHNVTDEASMGALNFLLDNASAHLQLIVTSRTRSGLPLSRLRVRDQVVEVDAAALRFDLSESREFLIDLGGLALDHQDVAHVRDSTDGWVAALQLASLSLRESDDPQQLIEHLSGSNRVIGDFLAQNVLDTLEPEILDFLLTTSVTQRTCGSLASVLAGVRNGHALLEKVEERELFLRRVDEDGEWFRYHPLFAEYLRNRLARDHPGRSEDLSRVASDWFAEHRHWGEAVDLALVAGDPDRALHLVESNAAYLQERSRMVSILGLIAKLPPRLVEGSVRLQLDLAWANVHLHRDTATEAALDRVKVLLGQEGVSAPEAADLAVEADVARSVLLVFSDRDEGVEALLAECLSRPDSLRPYIVSVAANIASAVESRRFEYDKARRTQAWAMTYHLRTEDSFSLMYGYTITGIAANEQLDIAAAEDHFRRALRVAEHSTGRRSHATDLPVRNSACCCTSRTGSRRPDGCWTRVMNSARRAAEWTSWSPSTWSAPGSARSGATAPQCERASTKVRVSPTFCTCPVYGPVSRTSVYASGSPRPPHRSRSPHAVARSTEWTQ